MTSRKSGVQIGGFNLKKTVAVIECNNYEPEKVQEAVNSLINLLGGWKAFVQPRDSILIKPNLLSKKRPDEAVTTHPSVVEAVAMGIAGVGEQVILADSPGGPFSASALQRVYKGCGMTEVAAKSGAVLNYNVAEATLKVPAGGILAGITVMEVITRAGGVISVSKLKTHGMTRLTGAVKNLFGTIPGLKKAEYHVNMPQVEDFSAMLVDVARTIAPRLHIMDAVVGMEGEGPSAGEPKHIGVLMASACPFALDLVASALVAIEPQEVPTIVEAIKRGYIDGDVRNISLLGDPVCLPKVRFRLPPKARDVDLLRAGSRGRLPGWLLGATSKLLRPSPNFSHDICLGCGECSQLCPPQAIQMENKKPCVDLERCIRCFCCQELCPHKAVKIKRPWLGRLLFK